MLQKNEEAGHGPVPCPFLTPVPCKHNGGCNGIYYAACSLQLFMIGLNDYSP